MTVRFKTTRLLAICIALSVLVHILSFYAWKMSGTYDFSAPVNPSQAVMVDLNNPDETAAPSVNQEENEDSDTEPPTEEVISEEDSVPADSSSHQPKLTETIVKNSEKTNSSSQNSKTTGAIPPVQSRLPNNAPSNNPLLGNASNFLTSKNEKLTYLVSMFGLPIGSAELEAKNENGEIWLTLRVKSNTAVSSVFPVDDLVETRHISGKFIMSKIRQQEGTFKSDEVFTINLNKKRVSWFDNVRGHNLTTAVPTDEVLDSLSAIYYLRNRPLEIGKNETLHIYDSETYAEVPVKVLRREALRLPNLQQVDTLVIKPLQKTTGIFRRTEDVLIWMTDNALKVPVKIVTSVAHGTVTLELLSAEATPQEADTTKIK